MRPRLANPSSTHGTYAAQLVLAVAVLFAGCRDVKKDPQYCETCGIDAAVVPPQGQATQGGGAVSESANSATAVGGGGSPGSASMAPAAVSGTAGQAGSLAAGSGAGAAAVMRMDAGFDAGFDAGKDAGDSSTALPDSSTKPDAAPVDAGQPDTAPPSACGGQCPSDAPVCNEAKRLCVQCTQNDRHACTGDNPVCDVGNNVCVPCSVSEAGACGGQKSVCDTDSLTCVECSARRLDTCTGDKRVCDTEQHVCVECSAAQPNSCDAAGKHCLVDMQRCVACIEPMHCMKPESSSCDPNQHTCQPCTDNQACAHIAGMLTCDPIEHRCVECTKATEGQRCPPGASCDDSHKCQANPPPPTQGPRKLCESCTQQSDCASTAGCVAYPGLGSFCFPKAQDHNCTMQPYSRVMTQMFDQGYADFCLPIASCKAILDTNARIACSRDNGQPDDKCGDGNLHDGRCNSNKGCSYLCTMPQGLECPPGFSCRNGTCQ